MSRLLSRLCETPALIYMNISVSVSSLWEYGKVVWHYYGNAKFRHADMALLKAYRWSNPYRVHRKFLESLGEKEVYCYGESPLTTLHTLARTAGIGREDSYVELGCGRGRTCFWVGTIIGCPSYGIDYVPTFIDRAQKVADALKIDNIHFFCRNFLTEEWPKGTVFYVDATLLEDQEVACLIRRFDELPEGCRAICVNLSLVSDYPDEKTPWREETRLLGRYSWGEAEVAIFRKMGMGQTKVTAKK